MYDLSSKFDTFYKDYVVLPQADQNELHNKKNLNVQRLKDGLAEYNAEHGTSYKVVDTCVQGSVAMSTVVQNDDKEYDIDVAIVFDKTALGDKGAKATRNMVADALRRKAKQFNAEPEVKTSCVRVQYADGYHIDFAVFRRDWDPWTQSYKYEHAGSEWTDRDLTGLTDWFKEENNSSDGKLRKVVRLSKMFCKSRESWKNMPSGLLQTNLCDEKLQSAYSRIDELFYYTMKGIADRLESDASVSAPVDNGRDLTPRKSDLQKMTNWKNRLKSKIEDLEVLFKDDCSQDDALQAWYGFFNHDYWSEQVSEQASFSLATVQKSAIRSYRETEDFIEDYYQLEIKYRCRVSCHVSGDGWRDTPLKEFLGLLRRFVPHHFKVKCVMVYTDCPKPYRILWKVKNVGPEAERQDCLRGQILERGESITEPTSFYGYHYIECYIVKENVCVARTRIDVPIGRR